MSTDAFQDFSYATHWEKFAGEIEQVLRRWLWTRENSLSQEHCTITLKQKLHFRKEPYVLTLQLPGELQPLLDAPIEGPGAIANSPESVGSYSSSSASDEGEEFESLPQEDPQPEAESKAEKAPRTRSNPVFSKGLFVSPTAQFDEEGLHLQRWFGISRCVLLQAGSQSGRILDAQEASTLLSAASVALSEFPRPLPIFLPVQNSFRDAYRGVAIVDGRSVFFDVDSSHLTQQPEHLRSVTGQLQVMAKQLHRYSPKGARLCDDIACGVDSQTEGYEVHVSSCVTYKLPLPTTSERLKIQIEDQSLEQLETEMMVKWSEEWDEGCVWQPWAAQKDPVASLELDLVWADVELTPENPTPVLSAMSAASWRVTALSEERHAFESWAIFSSKNSFHRRHLRFPSVAETLLDSTTMEFDGDNFRSLSAKLGALLQATFSAQAARSVEDLASAEWWDEIGTRGPTIPPEETFKDTICDMFGESYTGRHRWSMTKSIEYCDPPLPEGINSDSGSVQRCALSRLVPLDSLTARLGLHAVIYRNARAVAWLWSRFVQVIRLQYWEKLKRIPLTFHKEEDRDVEPESPDLNACLLHQKLQMLNVCIHRLVKKRRTKSVDASALEDDISDYESCLEENLPEPGLQEQGSVKSKGVASILDGAFLESNPEIPINIPITQWMPVHTSDSLMEEETLLSALHDSPEDRERAAREQAKVLLSDMAAFKAANPDAQLGDFVKWHSPKDWVKQSNGEGSLSTRMSRESGNRWVKHWEEVEPSPAVEQIPLFDPAMAGERALYFLETIEPVKLFWQLFQIGLLACFGCLRRGSSSKIKRIQEECALFHKAFKEGLPQIENHPDHASELLEKFRTLERSVVTGESLLRHLPGCEATVSCLLEGILATPPGGQESSPERPRHGVSVPESDKEQILRLLLHIHPSNPSEEEAVNENGQRKTLIGTVLQHEWVVSCSQKGCESDQGALSHRIYFKDAVNEVRLGTVLVSDL